MKKYIVLFLAAVMLLNLAACGQKPTPAEEHIVGGWTAAESPEITDEVKALLDKAMEGMTGVTLKPVAYLASQVVAGTNHAILCRKAPVVQDPVETWAVVTLYADLQGNAEITDIRDFEKETWLSDGPMAGGWFLTESPVLTDEAKSTFTKALEGYEGAVLQPLALVSQQVVAGMNYCYVCAYTPSEPNAQTTYALAWVYRDLQGGAQITEVLGLPDASAN